jgi:predicted naringenin-chalcone synthase
MEKKVYIHKISTAVPEYYYTQKFALDYQLNLICDSYKKKVFLEKVYRDTAINKRHTVINDYGKRPEDFTFYPKNDSLEPEPTTEQRNDLFISESNRLSLEASEKLLAMFPENFRSKITHVITVSCTGFSAPGFDFHIVKNLGLQRTADRFHLGFMGCYAAFPALKMAYNFCLANPEARVLVVNVELCSLHYQKKFDPDTIVANAIFADGISACLVSADENDSGAGKLEIKAFYSTFTDDSENDMAWKIGARGFDMKLSYYVPKIIDANMKGILERILEKSGLKFKDIDVWAIHPGGKAILEKLENSIGLKKDDMKHSYDILWNYGNMSSSTILFVLDDIMKNGKNGNIFAAGFGPGLTIETAILEKK